MQQFLKTIKGKQKYLAVLAVILCACLVIVYFLYKNNSVGGRTFSFPKSAAIFLSSLDIAKENEPPKEIVLLGKAEVSYKGGVINRNKNIEIGIKKIDGTVVHPGEEFSFLKTLGPVLEDDGFKEAKSFLNGEVVLGLGGGLCHVSTTLFQGVLAAGLPITERHNHTFTVPYYKTGLDATISDFGPDLKFINDTGYDITIRGKVENEIAIFEIYGVADGRVVDISEVEVFNHKTTSSTKYTYTKDLPPGKMECDSTFQEGFSAKRIYDVLYPTGVSKSTEFLSVYKPLGKSCRVGVDESGALRGCTETTLYSPLTGHKCPRESTE